MISRYVSEAEGYKSPTAIRLGIYNMPGDATLRRMEIVAHEVFDPLREAFGRPLRVTSFYRSPILNKAVNGSPTSQHVRGEAIDIDGDPAGLDNAELFDYVRRHLPFDQLIWEYGTARSPAWVHASYVTHRPNRGQVLRVLSGGATQLVSARQPPW
ncbi:Peptidase M15 [Hymenobacter daecheongensis DSM 21074]|uniref:Peptidase M15 n=1 Tax=Hymenobacter daecheongensis DSM 21074 TaxID=1121955 RepID=A0A1M6ISF1_9BACT|nr:D-Ala-D-Ala carboxypeptidase family metallohydrolase [Hymenobacter daecheongensis]SHJ37297.1 Peptidase M15 [Hymenobacter daecheongensis DSM 21074]